MSCLFGKGQAVGRAPCRSSTRAARSLRRWEWAITLGLSTGWRKYRGDAGRWAARTSSTLWGTCMPSIRCRFCAHIGRVHYLVLYLVLLSSAYIGTVTHSTTLWSANIRPSKWLMVIFNLPKTVKCWWNDAEFVALLKIHHIILLHRLDLFNEPNR